MSIQAVLFDADGVIQTTPEERRDRLKGFLPDAAKFDEFLMDIFAAEYLSVMGEGVFAANLQTVLARWNVATPIEQVLTAWTLIKPIDGIKALTARLRLKNILSCIASSQESYRAHHMSQVLGYQHIFDREFYSCNLGVVKSNPRFFELVIDALKADPSELLFIDDNPEIVNTASSTGLNAAVFNAQDHPDPASSLSYILSQYGV